MILFLYGPDTFRSKKKLSEIIGKYRLKYKSGLNLAKIELSEDNLNKLREAVETSSMFQEKKLVILKNVFSSSKSLQKKISEYLKKKGLFEDKNIILVFFEEGKIKNKNNLFKLILKNSFKNQEFKELPPSKTEWIIKKEVEKLNGEIHPLAIKKLVFFYGNNLWQISNEVKKLISFKREGTIQPEDVENLCEANINLNIFKTIEAISKKNKKEALKLISKHFETGENTLKIFGMIVYQFRVLIKIKSILEENKNNIRSQKLYRQFRKSGIHPFVIKKTLPIAKNFSMEELKRIYQKLFQLDLEIKTGKIEPGLGIEMFVTGL